MFFCPVDPPSELITVHVDYKQNGLGVFYIIILYNILHVTFNFFITCAQVHITFLQCLETLSLTRSSVQSSTSMFDWTPHYFCNYRALTTAMIIF